MGLIYVLQSPDGKMYVGQTRRELHVRLREHWNARGTAIGQAIRRYGRWDPASKTIVGFRVLAFPCRDDRLAEREARLIARLATLAPRGYNRS